VLVHGAAADHTTWRVVAPMLAQRHAVHAVDRRGRGGSGDTAPYAIEREFEDVAAVAEALAGEAGSPVPVVGHSFGGRVALGAALLTPAIDRVVSYEGAPAPPDRPYQAADLVGRLAALATNGRDEELLETFLREVVGMDERDLSAYRANPVWPERVRAAPTVVRELAAEASPAAALSALGAVAVPVLQVLGSDSLLAFHDATRALDERLATGRIVVLASARHAAHHTHPDAFVAAAEAFLAER